MKTATVSIDTKFILKSFSVFFGRIISLLEFQLFGEDPTDAESELLCNTLAEKVIRYVLQNGKEFALSEHGIVLCKKSTKLEINVSIDDTGKIDLQLNWI